MYIINLYGCNFSYNETLRGSGLRSWLDVGSKQGLLFLYKLMHSKLCCWAFRDNMSKSSTHGVRQNEKCSITFAEPTLFVNY